MSLVEIKQLIEDKGLTFKLLPGYMMKELTWSDQWIGYDDEDTAAIKKQFANNLCFGGTTAWSVNFNSGEGSDLEPPVTTNGQCDPNNGGTVCGNGFGTCCSASGWWYVFLLGTYIF
jgi:chitinase